MEAFNILFLFPRLLQKKTYIDLKYFFGIKEAEIKKVLVICRFQRKRHERALKVEILMISIILF